MMPTELNKTQVLTHTDILKTMEMNGVELLPCLSLRTSRLEDYFEAVAELIKATNGEKK